MSNAITLSPTDTIQLGAEIANFIMFREWNVPHSERVALRRITLSEESVSAIADEVAARLV